MAEEKNSNSMHWADKYAREVLGRKQKDLYISEAGISPSGVVHIGNFREVMSQYLVYRGLSEKTKAKFQYFWDDYDRFRKVPAGVSEEWKKYIGMPLSKVPDPWKCHKSYSMHFMKQMEEETAKLGIEPKYIYSTDVHEKCMLAEEMKTALEKTEKIKEILNKFRKEELEEDWIPVIVYCERCFRDSTKVTYSGGYSLSYTCECGNSDTFDFRKKGLAKMRWRVDWPARWHYYDVDFESSGKDHHAAGGSWDTCTLISKEVFEHEPPIGPMYEFIYLKGQKEKMSSSIGNVAVVGDLLEIYEPEVIKYIYTARINRSIDMPFDTDILNVYNYYDTAERTYYGLEKSKDENEKRRYELCQTRILSECPIRVPFSTCTSTIQIAVGNIDLAVEKLKKMGAVPDEISGDDLERVKLRLTLAKNWVDKYAPDDQKIILLKEMPKMNVPENIGEILSLAADKIEVGTKGEELQNFIYNTSREKAVDMKEVFKTAYKLLLGKEKGPRLGPFLVSLEKDFVINRLRRIE